MTDYLGSARVFERTNANVPEVVQVLHYLLDRGEAMQREANLAIQEAFATFQVRRYRAYRDHFLILVENHRRGSKSY